MGWYLDEANLAQVSLNLLDYEKTNIQTAFEECSKDAKVICQYAFLTMIIVLIKVSGFIQQTG